MYQYVNEKFKKMRANGREKKKERDDTYIF